ncbi:transcriptional regulator [Rhodoferax sp. AJA081-3]|uniref:helix-turn-helix domain-containing protein n=1 Tax=Rhodoferax sp. AJA081-3 TaxID=2752316 RepID=UPI001AE00D00|nr:transcriptional regulator [Rhodoferax sp. AJA081-3]QTN29541.1 transcriptional regulator [Rhodoferax sp. AJA081-3]
MNLSDITAHWVALHESLGLGGPVRDEAHYDELMGVVEALMGDAYTLESGPMGGLVDLVADRIREYEDRVHPWPDTSTPATRLAFLMEQHGLRQSDLPEVGAQSLVSAVLSGKRDLNLRQVQALAKRFGVPMDALA